MKIDLSKHVGSQLKKMRISYGFGGRGGLSLFAEKIGRSPSDLYRIESDLDRQCGEKIIRIYLTALGVRNIDLIGAPNPKKIVPFTLQDITPLGEVFIDANKPIGPQIKVLRYKAGFVGWGAGKIYAKAIGVSDTHRSVLEAGYRHKKDNVCINRKQLINYLRPLGVTKVTITFDL